MSHWAGELGAKDFWTRWYAAYALGRLGPEAADAAPALERVLANLGEDEYVRGGAAWALGRMGPKASGAVPLLTRILTSQHASVRRNAAEALGNLAPVRLAAAVHDIPSSAAAGETPGMKGLGDPDPKTAAVVAGLATLLNDEDVAVRANAAVALWRIRRDPKAVAALESMLRDRNGSIACRAAAAIGELGAEGELGVPSLVAALAHPDNDTRRAAAQSLGRIGPAAIPALRGVLAGGQNGAKCQAVEALGWIGPTAVAALIAALGDSNAPVRRSAARALGRLGPAARQAEPALVKVVSDSQPEVRDAAADALKRIRGA